MAIRLWELRSNLSFKGAASSTKGITRNSVNTIKEKANNHMIYVVLLNE